MKRPIDKVRHNGIWNYEGFNFSNDLEALVFYGGGNATIFGINYNLLNGRRFKSDIGTYDIGLEDKNTTDIAWYANGNYHLNNFNFVYGARQYHSSYKNVALSNFSVRGGLTYQFEKNTIIKALFGEAFRVPTYFEKEVNSASVKGNSNLEPEKSTSYDIVFSTIHGGIQYDIDLFLTTIKEKITRIDIGNGIKQNQNIGTTVFHGLEINSKFHFSKGIFGFAGYAYTKGKNDNTNENLKFTYENMIIVGLSMKLSNRFTLSSSAKYLSDWDQADTYVIVNSNLSYQLMPSIKLQFKADNMFGENVDLPEIARDNSIVPTIPKMYESAFHLGIIFDF